MNPADLPPLEQAIWTASFGSSSDAMTAEKAVTLFRVLRENGYLNAEEGEPSQPRPSTRALFVNQTDVSLNGLRDLTPALEIEWLVKELDRARGVIAAARACNSENPAMLAELRRALSEYDAH